MATNQHGSGRPPLASDRLEVRVPAMTKGALIDAARAESVTLSELVGAILPKSVRGARQAFRAAKR